MHRMMTRATSIVLVAALATALSAPAAEAGRRHRRVVRHHPVIIERHSDAAGAVFGFLGGLVLGTVIANAQPAPVCERGYEPDYDYYDPYCRETYGSLDRYEDHLRRHRHPPTAEVVDARSGRQVDSVRWRDGRWVADDDYDRDDRAPVTYRETPAYEEWDD